MNKWRLLLFSILGLFQSTATERNFLNGRVRHRWSETRLSIYEPHQGPRFLSVQRQLIVPEDLHYSESDVKVTKLSAKHRESHLSPSTRNKSLFLDRRQTDEKFKDPRETDYNRRSSRQSDKRDNKSIRSSSPSRDDINEASKRIRLSRLNDMHDCIHTQGESYRLYERENSNSCIKLKRASPERHDRYVKTNEINNQLGQTNGITYKAPPRISKRILSEREERKSNSLIARNLERIIATHSTDSITQRVIRNSNNEQNLLNEILHQNGHVRLQRKFNGLVSNKNTLYEPTIPRNTLSRNKRSSGDHNFELAGNNNFFKNRIVNKRLLSESPIERDIFRHRSLGRNTIYTNNIRNINTRYTERHIDNELFYRKFSDSRQTNTYEIRNTQERNAQENKLDRQQSLTEKRFNIVQNYLTTTSSRILDSWRNIENTRRDRSQHLLTERRETNIKSNRNMLRESTRLETREERNSNTRISPEINIRQFISRREKDTDSPQYSIVISTPGNYKPKQDSRNIAENYNNHYDQSFDKLHNEYTMTTSTRRDSLEQRKRHVFRSDLSVLGSRISENDSRRIRSFTRHTEEKISRELRRKQDKETERIIHTRHHVSLVRENFAKHESREISGPSDRKNTHRNDFRQDTMHNLEKKVADKHVKNDREKILMNKRQVTYVDKNSRQGKTNMRVTLRSRDKIEKNVRNIKNSHENGKIANDQISRVNRETRRTNRKKVIGRTLPSLTLSIHRLLETELRQDKTRLSTDPLRAVNKREDRRRSETSLTSALQRINLKCTRSTENSEYGSKDNHEKLSSREQLSFRKERYEVNSRLISTFTQNLKQLKTQFYVRVRSIPTINIIQRENKFEWKWEYLFYLLQGIYVCGLILSKPNEKLNMKTRVINWITSTQNLKLD